MPTLKSALSNPIKTLKQKLPLGKYEDTIKECTKALELNPAYPKALVRRGKAHEDLEYFEEGIAGEDEGSNDW
ncbi:hypothetical protein K1719_016730 [Acacia pycnantha]|nr:hypothetical protein K1719_016730 [Acacia pycnantha]